MAETYTYDLATAIGQLRLLVQDNDISSTAPTTKREQRSAAFTDEELAYMLTIRPDVGYAAALVLRVWANNKQLIVQTRTNSKARLDYGTIRTDLLKAADAYEAMAVATPADATAEMGWSYFNERRIIWNQWLRTDA